MASRLFLLVLVLSGSIGLIFKTCDAILFLEGRIAFLDGGMNPVVGNNADSILIAFGDENVEALRSCGLAGEFWDKRQK